MILVRALFQKKDTRNPGLRGVTFAALNAEQAAIIAEREHKLGDERLLTVKTLRELRRDLLALA